MQPDAMKETSAQETKRDRVMELTDELKQAEEELAAMKTGEGARLLKVARVNRLRKDLKVAQHLLLAQQSFPSRVKPTKLVNFFGLLYLLFLPSFCPFRLLFFRVFFPAELFLPELLNEHLLKDLTRLVVSYVDGLNLFFFFLTHLASALFLPFFLSLSLSQT
jgi:hypothetical protein